MNPTPHEKTPQDPPPARDRKEREEQLDETIEESFPASDPPAHTTLRKPTPPDTHDNTGPETNPGPARDEPDER